MSESNQIAAERMYLTADKSAVVAEGSKDAAFLYASPGDEIPPSACERFGIKDGKLPGAKKPAAKAKAAPEDKAKAAPEDKGA